MADTEKPGFWKRLLHFVGSALSHDRHGTASRAHRRASMESAAYNSYPGPGS